MLKVRESDRSASVAIFFVGDDALYGRYWGRRQLSQPALRDLLLQGIEYCIDKKLPALRTGTQGEHKCPGGSCRR